MFIVYVKVCSVPVQKKKVKSISENKQKWNESGKVRDREVNGATD